MLIFRATQLLFSCYLLVSYELLGEKQVGAPWVLS
jgi:hypothetical protein